MSFIFGLILIILIKDSIESQINIIESTFSKTGSFEFSDDKNLISVTFDTPFNSIPKIIVSQLLLDSSNQTQELNYGVNITNINKSGFQAQLISSSLSQVFRVNYTYIATVGESIFYGTQNININDMKETQDSIYKIYTKNYPYSQQNFISNSKMQSKAVGFMTGFYVKYQPKELDVYFNISYDESGFQIQVKQKLEIQAKLISIQFNYFEFYYSANSSIMIDMYQDFENEIIIDQSNCLINNKIEQQYTQDLGKICKQGLHDQELTEMFSRVQTTVTPINVKHTQRKDFALGFSKLSCDLTAQNVRVILWQFYIDQNSNSLYITYYTWQGTRVLGIASTIVELYSLECPEDYFYSFKYKDCVQNCESQTYKELNSNNKQYLPTCNPCYNTCQECSGPEFNNCTVCTPSFPYFNTLTKKCLEQQPISYFCINDNSLLPYQKNCSQCHSTCLTCQGSLSNNCLSCQNSYPFYNSKTNSCSNEAPTNFYCKQNKSDPIYQFNCNECNSNCLTCQGPQQNNCLTCPNNLPYFNTSTKECLLQAPVEGYFCQKSSTPQPIYQQNCYPCHVSCLNCKGSLKTDCISCSSAFPYFNTQTTICEKQKPDQGFFCTQSLNYPTQQQDCYPCDDTNCVKCIDKASNSCIQCQPNTYLLNKNCSLTKPSLAYCDIQKNCQTCTIQFCIDCDQGPQTCNVCYPSFQMDQNSKQCQCPYASYLDTKTSSCQACPKNCLICKSSLICQQCASNYSLDPLYPGSCIKKCEEGQFYNRKTQNCQKCSPTCLTCSVSQDNCQSCQNSAQIVFDQTINQNKCSCKDSLDTLNQDTGICSKCSDPMCLSCDTYNRSLCLQCIQLAQYSQDDLQCKCVQSAYYSQDTKTCKQCPQKNCQTCLPDGSQCVKCKNGFFFDNRHNTCNFCTSGKYSDNENKCTQNCQEQCEYCSDSKSCYSYYLNATFTGNQCHFSCSKCSGDNMNQCLDCSSPTRIFDQQTKRCVCQSSYVEIDQQDCQFRPYPSILYKISSIMTTIQFIIYFPTIFVNHHPFSDYFLMNSQLIGNHYYSQQPEQLGIFVCHNAKFNYFNLFDNQILLFSYDVPTMKNYLKTSNLMLLFGYTFISYAFVAVGYIYFQLINKKSININLNLKDFFNYNLFVKVNRISSNMIIIYTINNLDVFRQISLSSVCLVAYGIFYILFTFLQIYVINKEPAIESFKYLKENLNFHLKLSKFFWFFGELKKISFCLFFLLSEKIYLWAQFGVCILSLIINIFIQPFQKKKLDVVYVIFSDILQILMMLNFSIAIQSSQDSQSLQNFMQNNQLQIKIFLILLIFLATLHISIVIEYSYRLYLQFKCEQFRQSFIQRQSERNNCFELEQQFRQEGISISQISNILNTKSFQMQFSRKRSKENSFF